MDEERKVVTCGCGKMNSAGLCPDHGWSGVNYPERPAPQPSELREALAKVIARSITGPQWQRGLDQVIADSVLPLIQNHLSLAAAAAVEKCCRAVKPFEPDGADDIELAIRSLHLDPLALLHAHDAQVRAQAALEEAKWWTRRTVSYGLDKSSARLAEEEQRIAALTASGKEPTK